LLTRLGIVKQRSNTLALFLAIASAVVSPVLLFVEFSGLFLVGMILFEPSNSVVIKTIAVAALILLAALALALPLLAFFSNSSAVSRVIAGLVLVGWAAAQLYLAGMIFGVCSFEGCFPA
jgi:hypothetical protein